MKPETVKYLWDALTAAERIEAFVIPELDRVVAFRNILIHSYASVDDRLVWGVVDGKLGALIDVLKDILRRAEA